MSRIPDIDIDRIKREVSLEEIARSRGMDLRRQGADLVTRCFSGKHEDRHPSMRITPRTNLFRCPACDTGGSVIDFVMQVDRLPFREAAEALLLQLPGGPSRPVYLLHDDMTDEELLAGVVAHYAGFSSLGRPYLESRELGAALAMAELRIGFGGRSLGDQMPPKSKREDGVRARLQKLGILWASGHERFRGSVLFPLFDEEGKVRQLYGRRTLRGLRLDAKDRGHMHLAIPIGGIWNWERLLAAGAEEVILTEAVLDGLTFRCAGFCNVTATLGAESFTSELHAFFKRHGTRRVLIAFDADDGGDRGARKVAARLEAEGIGPYRVQFPKGMDANEYARKVKPAAKSLGLVLANAVWMGQGPPPARSNVYLKAEIGEEKLIEKTAAREEAAAPSPAASSPPTTPVTTASTEAAREESMADAGPAPDAPPVPPSSSLAAAPSPAPPKPIAIPCEVSEDEVVITLGDRRYRVRGLHKNQSHDVLKVNLFGGRDDGSFHVDTLDLYISRQRQSFITMAGKELHMEEEIAKRDLGLVMSKLEELLDEERRKAKEPKQPVVTMSTEERAEAMALLKDQSLLDRILEDFERCGMVGERTNKLVAYVTATGRKLEEPNAIMVRSSSASGKSTLMEAVLAFMPHEDRVQYSALTAQALFYLGDMDLKHKILALAEQEGAARASYPMKLLLSEGEISIASTGKDPVTGKLVTHTYQVKGPVMLLTTSTAIWIDEELENRCIVLTVDEGREQTRAIHRKQREALTLEGMVARTTREKVRKLHQNAQRLLEVVMVHVPFAARLQFPDHALRTRRDHMKYLVLIQSVTLLHQHQRPRRRAVVDGQEVSYIDATVEDVTVANELANEVLGRSLDELGPQTRGFLQQLHEMVKKGCEEKQVERTAYRLSRREVLDETGLSLSQVRRHLARLVDYEYVLVHRGARGDSFVYELLYNGEGTERSRFMMGLLDVERLRDGSGASTTAEMAVFSRGVAASEGHMAVSWSPHGPPLAGGWPPPGNGQEPSNGTASSGSKAKEAENAHRGGDGKGPVRLPDRHRTSTSEDEPAGPERA